MKFIGIYILVIILGIMLHTNALKRKKTKPLCTSFQTQAKCKSRENGEFCFWTGSMCHYKREATTQ